MILKNIIPFVHSVLSECVKPGDTVIDATAGNGADTVFLARCVGDAGHVFAFDVQAAALAATTARLTENGLEKRVSLLATGHETIKQFVPPGVRAVLFNCGYLPGGDKSVSTQASTTLAALESSLALLLPGGLAAVVLYPGHAAGRREAEAVSTWAHALPQHDYNVLTYNYTNRINNPPYALLVEKLELPSCQDIYVVYNS